jgi:late competence protein required for DNA uptake (superfamily II DNA/RNA helicase)
MATDYDAPRKTDQELQEDSLEELKAQHAEKTQASAVDIDEAEAAESIELPGADLSDQTLSVLVVPKQAGEFTCFRCNLVHQQSAKAADDSGRPYCRDCDY